MNFRKQSQSDTSVQPSPTDAVTTHEELRQQVWKLTQQALQQAERQLQEQQKQR